MTGQTSNEAGGGPLAPAAKDVGPDRANPMIGAGVTLLGIFLMGVGGARGAHYLFDFGVLTAVLGAILFVLFVAAAAMKQRRSGPGAKEPPGG